MPPCYIKPGDVFTRLTVIRRVTNHKPGRPAFECRCVCGTTLVVPSSRLVLLNTRSCGCLKIEAASRNVRAAIKSITLPPLEAATTIIRCRYIAGARRRGIPFNLSNLQVTRLITAPCHYCGQPPCAPLHSSGRQLGLFNGIDRRDNLKSYTVENSVPCCKRCNVAKGELSEGGFLSWAHRAHAHMVATGSYGQ